MKIADCIKVIRDTGQMGPVSDEIAEELIRSFYTYRPPEVPQVMRMMFGSSPDAFESVKPGNITINWGAVVSRALPSLALGGIGVATTGPLAPLAGVLFAIVLAATVYDKATVGVPQDSALILMAAWKAFDDVPVLTVDAVKAENEKIRKTWGKQPLSDQEFFRYLDYLGQISSLQVRGADVTLMERVSKKIWK